jgi:hypothetical protein
VLGEAAPAVSLHTAAQDEPGSTLHVRDLSNGKPRLRGNGTPRSRRSTPSVQPLLPGLLLDQD